MVKALKLLNFFLVNVKNTNVLDMYYIHVCNVITEYMNVSLFVEYIYHRILIHQDSRMYPVRVSYCRRTPQCSELQT